MRAGVLIAAVAVLFGLTLVAPTTDAAEDVLVRVLDAEGEPVRGARVAVAWPHATGRQRTPLLTVVSDADGRAALSPARIPEGADLCVLAPATRCNELNDHVQRSWDREPRVVTLSPAHSLRGVVLDPERNPVPHARIGFRYMGRPTGALDAPGGEVVGRHDGTFEISRLPPGRYALYAIVDESDGRDTRSEVVRAETGQEAGVVLPTAPRDPVPKRVFRFVTADGVAVSHGEWYAASVRGVERGDYTATVVRGGGGTWKGEAAVRDAVSDPLAIRVFHPRSRLGLPLPAGPTTAGPFDPGVEDVVVEMQPPRAISGRLVALDGDTTVPVALAEIEAVATPELDDRGQPGGRSSRRTRSHGSRLVHERTVSDLEGRFRFGSLADGEYELRVVRSSGFRKPAPVPANAGDDDVVIELARGRVVQITVSDAAGEPLEGAVVRLMPLTESGRALDEFPSIEATSDADGIATVAGLEPGLHYRLWVSAPMSRSELLDFDIALWKPESREVRLQAGRTLGVEVHTSDGEPVRGARVAVQSVDVKYGERVTTTTDSSGACTFSGLAPVTWKVTASLTRMHAARPWGGNATYEVSAEPQVVELDEGSTVKLVLDPPTGLRIAVTNWERRHRDVEAVVTTKGGEPLRKAIDSDGNVEFEGLPWSAEFSLWIGPVAGDRHVLRTGLFTSDQTHEVELVEGRGVRGRVRFPADATDRRVWLPLPGVDLEAEVDGTGRFKIAAVPPGDWRVHASARLTDREVTADAPARPGESVEIDLRE